jgi:cytosine/adenosine deaminase-related metal-dependent hydrolase
MVATRHPEEANMTQAEWKAQILARYAGASDQDLMAAFTRRGFDAVIAAGITTPALKDEFRHRVDAHVRAASARWVIDNQNFLALSAALDLIPASA